MFSFLIRFFRAWASHAQCSECSARRSRQIKHCTKRTAPPPAFLSSNQKLIWIDENITLYVEITAKGLLNVRSASPQTHVLQHKICKKNVWVGGSAVDRIRTKRWLYQHVRSSFRNPNFFHMLHRMIAIRQLFISCFSDTLHFLLFFIFAF